MTNLLEEKLKDRFGRTASYILVPTHSNSGSRWHSMQIIFEDSNEYFLIVKSLENKKPSIIQFIKNYFDINVYSISIYYRKL